MCEGMAMQLGPMYLLEIAPFNLKGAFGTACQLFCTIGIFTGSVFGLREILGKIDSQMYYVVIFLSIISRLIRKKD